MNRLLHVFAFVTIFVPSAFAQETTVQGTNPPSLKWYQVNTGHFRVLYPDGFDREAQRVANTLEHIYEPESKSLGARPKKISLLLQNQSSVSNGFVTLAPRRSEFYAMPSQNYNLAGTNDWLSLLASHEYRHIVQFQKSITGFNKIVYYAFGQTALSGLAFVAAPMWFWEGDAVATETAFTASGRGQIPNFNLLFRTNLLEGRTFDYHKQYMRSYQHNIPNHYVLGYNLVSYVRKKTGNADIWGNIAKHSWNVPFIPFAFSNAIKKETGLRLPQLYDEMAADLKKEWQAQVDTLALTSFEVVNPRTTKAYTDYMFPQLLQDGHVAAIKSGIGDIEQVVIMDGHGKENKVFVQGPLNDAGMFSAGKNRVVWNEFRYDPRWQVKTFSVIKGYDTETHRATTITKQSRYSAAALSPDGNKIATVETTSSYQIKLRVIDYSTGALLKEFPNPDNDLISMPRWSDDGNSIIVMKTAGSQRVVVRYEYETMTEIEILNLGSENIGSPVLSGHYLFYNSPYSGIDNIYVADLENGKRFQVTSGKYGAYNPAVSGDGKTLYYNNQARDGFDVVKTTLDPSRWVPIEKISKTTASYAQVLQEQEGHPDFLNQVPANTYEVKRYRKGAHLINPHTWGPYFVSSIYKLNLGLSSKDVLSTTILNLGYEYDVTERTGLWKASASYQGFYPILDFQFTEGNRSVNEGNYQFGNQVKKIELDWHERNVEGGIRIPLVTTVSKYSGYVSIGNAAGVTYVSNFKNSIDGGGRLVVNNSTGYLLREYVDNGNLIYNHASLLAYRLLRTSRRDIYSKWGQSLTVNSYSTPYGGDFKGNTFGAYTQLYFPGLAKHHSINGYVAYQSSQISKVSLQTGEGVNNYFFRNQIPTPRGQTVMRFQTMYSMAGNYTFPIAYPDLRVGQLLDIQRVRGNVFADYAVGKSRDFNVGQRYTSLGADIKFDFNVLRFLPQFNIGFRYEYMVQPAAGRFEVVLGNIGF